MFLDFDPTSAAEELITRTGEQEQHASLSIIHLPPELAASSARGRRGVRGPSSHCAQPRERTGCRS